MAFLEQVARVASELEGYDFDAASFVPVKVRPRSFKQRDGDFDEVINITVPHPWNEVWGFTVWMQWLSKDKQVVSVLAMTEASESRLFSGFTGGPDTVGRGVKFMSESALEEDRNDGQQ
ncbi:hypothetical protein [Oricola cellulosilytica]|uniref:Uncharacterized protein n=1 Tax=Oricola cellulosilytica TaxID=1429082 RepID=A0A4R0PDQ5_9HYPH|nr:hypothetical protein [Oricola cellulosilytica]TCD14459.1 hypothetical protein E0D97_10390 [Oricola cellulosilytica]